MLRAIMSGNISINMVIIWIVSIVLALSVHEFSHGFAAYRLGDMTAKRDGRISVNPLRHIDPMGFILILIAGFGWAKPVMVNPYNLRNPKQDMTIISIAGPASNFIFGFVALFAARIVFHFATYSTVTFFMWEFFTFLFSINIGLGIFNMLPIPPLDGSKFLAFFLPERIAFSLLHFPYGFILIIVLVFSGAVQFILGPVVDAVASGYVFVIDGILTLFM